MFLSEMLPSAWFLKPMWSMELITKAVNDIFSIYQTLLLSRGKNPDHCLGNCSLQIFSYLLLPCWHPSPKSVGLWLFIQFESVLQPGSPFSFLGWLYVYHHLKQTEEATVYRDREYLYLRIQWKIVISWDAWIGLFIYLFIFGLVTKEPSTREIYNRYTHNETLKLQ